MIKLLYITNKINGPGGLERVLSIKASYLANHYGYDIHILTLNQESNTLFYTFSKKITYHNINAKGNPFQYFIDYRKGIKEAIKIIGPQMVVVCDDGLKGLLLPLIIGKTTPMVYERHVSKNAQSQNDTPSFLQKLRKKILFKLMDFGGSYYDRFVVLTNGNKKEWDLKNVMVIPNPLSFYPDEQSTLQNKTVLAVGKQCFQKGYDRLLKSWKSVFEKHPDWSLNIYGTINEREGLQELANKLGINASVNFYPPVKNIAEKYQEASIYVMSSRYEGFGMVLTEAMAYGVPCVSFDCPYGPSDIIDNNINGILVENNDIMGLSNGIRRLIENEDIRINMGNKAKEDVQRYLPQKIVAKWDLLFKSLITG